MHPSAGRSAGGVAGSDAEPAPVRHSSDVGDLDAAGVLERSQVVLLSRRAAEVEDLRLVAQWALLHGDDPRQDPGASGFDVLVEIGGEGTPKVRDLCLGELAIVRRVHALSLRSAMADVLDLVHRLPRTWAQVEALRAEPWVARRVASMSRRLSLLDIGVVDAAVAACIAGESAARVLEVAEAKIIEADPAGHAARVEEQRRRRYVSISRSDEHGLRHLVARVEAGDAVYVDAMVARVAEILAGQVPADLPQEQRPTMDQLRSDALGWLARPAELLQLLLEHADADEAAGAPEERDMEADEEADPEPEAEPEATVSRALAFPADLLAALRSIDPTRLRPRATLYVHLTDQGLLHPETGVARIEDLGPLLAAHVRTLLGHCQVQVKPVIDVAEEVAAVCYEHAEPVKERVWMLVGGRDTFPWATGRTRRVDYDHPDPYRHGGPPGQTGTHNSQPLSRRNHRYKTHAGYRCRQLGPGTYAWRTPHGHHLIVGPHGTEPLDPSEGAALFRDP